MKSWKEKYNKIYENEKKKRKIPPENEENKKRERKQAKMESKNTVFKAWTSHLLIRFAVR
jgi:hypothetical protein